MAARVVVSDEVGAGPARTEAVERAARAALEDRGITDGELSVTLLDDRQMTAMNRQWKRRDAPTDVLAFVLHEPGQPPLGDIYLGVERAEAQAAELSEPPLRELARLAVHGTLHILGWDHPAEDRETSEMWVHQERIVEALGIQ